MTRDELAARVLDCSTETLVMLGLIAQALEAKRDKLFVKDETNTLRPDRCSKYPDCEHCE